MGSKKRKESTGSTDQPLKKNKKSKTGEVKDIPQPETKALPVAAPNPEPKTSSSQDVSAAKSKKSRKRAADFMDEEETPAAPDTSGKSQENDAPEAAEEPAKKKKSSKKSKKGKDDELLTADGVNGLIEHAEDANLDTATSHKPVSTSMQAEAERTVDQELEEGFGGFASEDDYTSEVETEENAAALLAGFDSDAEDDQEDEGFDISKAPAVATDKKVQKKLKKINVKENEDGPGTVYVGRIPHGFYEGQMKEYFSQFGEISRLRLSRNKRTGASKHFAFIEFGSKEVAKIVAETMDNYLLFGHILKCKYAEPDSLHPDVWKGANKKFRKIPHDKLERESLATPKTEDKWQKKVNKEQRKRNKKAEKMKSIGLDMPESTLTKPSDALKGALAKKAIAERTEAETADSAGLIEAPQPEPKDEVAKETKKTKKEKKEKKGKKEKSSAVTTSEPAETGPTLTEADAEAVDTEIAPGEDVEDAQEPKLSKAEKKALQKAAQAEKKASKAAKRAAKQAASLEEGDESADPVSDSILPTTNEEDLGADFISLGKFDEEPASESKGKISAGNKDKPWKVEKPKKDRKNLLKARGPKSALVSSKSQPEENANTKIPGLPLMGKGKYDKETRQANKELKKKILSERGGGRGGRGGAKG